MLVWKSIEVGAAMNSMAYMVLQIGYEVTNIAT